MIEDCRCVFLNKWVRQIFQFVYTFQTWHLSPKNKQFDFLSCVIKFKVLYGQGYVLVIYLAVFSQICFDLYLLQCQETYWVTLRLVFKSQQKSTTNTWTFSSEAEQSLSTLRCLRKNTKQVTKCHKTCKKATEMTQRILTHLIKTHHS